MDDDETAAWLGRWLEMYPQASDQRILAFRNRASLGLDELAEIYAWKFARLWPDKKIRGLRANATEDRARDWTRRALDCSYELGALLIAGSLPSAGPAGGSAILTVVDPERFTIMDSRAIASLTYLGRWDDTRGNYASYAHWLDYLDVCRQLRDLSGLTLRQVDQALYAADGRVQG